MTKISEKLITKYNKLKFTKIIDFSEIKLAKEILLKVESDLNDRFEGLNLDPSFKIYSIIQNQLSFFGEEFSDHKEFSEYYDNVVEIDDEYMPSFPPNSPLTGSYFTYWAFCDMRFGRHKETISRIFTDIVSEFKFDQIVLKGLSNLNESFMRFYKHLGFDNDLIILKDILTEKTFSCISSSGYRGEKNEIWYVRAAPNLDEVYDYQITLTTPYIIINYTEKDWLDFFQRQEISKEDQNHEKAYYEFMKNNKDLKYWHNYIMDGYVNYKSNCIFLTGIPDIKGSKPHEMDY